MSDNMETTIKAASLFNQASKFWSKGKSKGRNSDEETHPLDTESENGSSGGGLGESLKFWKKGPNLRESLNNKIQNMQVAAEDYKYGLISLGFGAKVIFLSMLYLPFIMIAP
jgi:hypothetical protein